MTSSEDLHELALTKLTNVLGQERAEAILDDALVRVGLERVKSPDDLHRLGQEILAQGGFAGAVGSLLSLMAVMRGATNKDSKPI
jgi:hypothetical protein